MIYSLCLLLIMIGFYGVVVSRNTLKIVISILIVEHGVHLLLVLIGYRSGGGPPIMDPGSAASTTFAASAVDPLPQALVLTSIVIGLGVLALMVALCVRLYERYGTFDVTVMTRLRG